MKDPFSDLTHIDYVLSRAENQVRILREMSTLAQKGTPEQLSAVDTADLVDGVGTFEYLGNLCRWLINGTMRNGGE